MVGFGDSVLRRGIFTTSLVFIAATLPLDSADAQSCAGWREPGTNTRIVGGNKANIKHWPGQATLRVLDPNGPESYYFCGGTAIAKDWILTAAHCFPNIQKNSEGNYVDDEDWRLQIVLGVGKLTSAGGANVKEISKIILHESYSSPQSGNDIALIKLKTPWNGDLAAISLSDTADPQTPPGMRSIVAGHGMQKSEKRGGSTAEYRSNDGSIHLAGSNRLLEVALPTVSAKICKARYKDVDQSVIAKGQLCAGYERGGMDSCQGDSGGPLVVVDQAGCPYQVGIVSWGAGCAEKKSYGVYTRISHHANWIKSVVSNVNAYRSLSETLVLRKQENFDLIGRALVRIRKAIEPQGGEVSIKIVGSSPPKYTATASNVRQLVLGDRFSFQINGKASGQLILLDINTEGQVTQIYPNKYAKKEVGALFKTGQVVRIPNDNYGFEAFQAVEPLGASKLVALIVPKEFNSTDLVTTVERITKGFAHEKAPTNYFMNLLEQVVSKMSAKGPENGQTGSTANNPQWAFAVLDYVIVR